MDELVLVIDDNKGVCENTAELLMLAGYKTCIATTGKEGLELIHKHKPSLILCDVIMPFIDGYSVLRAMENIPSMMGVPFIFMSAKSELTDIRKGMDCGADGYLPKPFTGDELLTVVSSKLRKYKLMKKSFENNLGSVNLLTNNQHFGQEICEMTGHKSLKKVRKKELIYMEGDSSNFIYFILSGKVKIYRTNEWGKEYITNILGKGESFGHNAVLEDLMQQESAVAMDATELVLIPKQDFFQSLQVNNEAAIKFIQILTTNCMQLEDKLLKLAYDSARKRVAEAIIFVSRKYQAEQNTDYTFELNRENISALSGISPESVSRNLSDFKQEGLIETMSGSIKIIDFRRLETLKN